MKKLRLGEFFINYGWVLLIILVISIVGWYWPISVFNQPKDYEKISIFIEGFDLSDDTLSSDLEEHLKDDGVLRVDISLYSPIDPLINSYYTAFGEEADILFLVSSAVDSMFTNYPAGAKEDWISYSPSLINDLSITGMMDYYVYEDEAYGLKIYDKDDSSYNRNIDELGIFKTDEFNEDVYIFLRKASPNFGSYSNEPITSNGIKSMNYILRRYGF